MRDTNRVSDGDLWEKKEKKTVPSWLRLMVVLDVGARAGKQIEAYIFTLSQNSWI